MFPRHLLAIRLSHDIIAHSNQDGIEILVRRSELPYERTSKRRIAASPIQGHVSRLGREAD